MHEIVVTIYRNNILAVDYYPVARGSKAKLAL